jgi:uncharacterized glyoxalase superfamily protein PhnB
MHNRSVPCDSLLPHLVYRNVAEAGAWLTRVFGFAELYRYGDPVSGIQMRLGNAVIMISGPREGRESPAVAGSCTQMLTVFLLDNVLDNVDLASVDAHYARTRQQGAMIVEELNETIYGERQYGVLDLDGHRWLFSQHARDVNPTEWGATLAAPLTPPITPPEASTS